MIVSMDGIRERKDQKEMSEGEREGYGGKKEKVYWFIGGFMENGNKKNGHRAELITFYHK